MSKRAELDRLRVEHERRQERWRARAMAAFAQSDAAILETTYGQRQLVIISPETYPGEVRKIRLTTFLVDGPWGHDNFKTRDEAIERVVEQGFKEIAPATDAEVIAWTSTPEFQLGTKRVEWVQLLNTAGYRLGGAKAREIEDRAARLWDEDPDAALELFRRELREALPRENPARQVKIRRAVTTLERSPTLVLPDRSTSITDPDLLAAALGDFIGDRAVESFLSIFLNVRNGVVGFTEYTSGGVASVEVNPGGIFRDALGVAAAGLVTVHNHPTGDPFPSNEDRALWNRLRQAGDIVGIPVVDNLVVGESSYYSEMADHIKRIARRIA